MPSLKEEAHELFCQELMANGFNLTKAYMATYGPDVTTPQAIRTNACRLRAREDISERMVELKEERRKRCDIDADYVLHKVHEMAEADISDVYNEDGTFKPVHEWPDVFRKGMVASVKAIETPEGAVIKEVKFIPREKTIEMVGKHVNVGAFRDKVSLENPDGSAITFIIRDMTKE